MNRTHFTSFTAAVIGLIGLGWWVVAAVLPPAWEHWRPILLLGGVLVLAVAGGVFLLARRTEGAE